MFRFFFQICHMFLLSSARFLRRLFVFDLSLRFFDVFLARFPAILLKNGVDFRLRHFSVDAEIFFDALFIFGRVFDFDDFGRIALFDSRLLLWRRFLNFIFMDGVNLACKSTTVFIGFCRFSSVWFCRFLNRQKPTKRFFRTDNFISFRRFFVGFETTFYGFHSNFSKNLESRQKHGCKFYKKTDKNR